MRCTIQGCPGGYEERLIVHTVRHRDQVGVFDNVPAEVCSVCGDMLLRPEKQILRTWAQPARTVPLYEYA